MSMAQPAGGAIPINPDLANLILAALDHAIDSVLASGAPLTPFLFIQKGEERVLQRFHLDILEDSVREARKEANRFGPEVLRCVLVHDAEVTIRGSRSDAIVAEGSDRSEEKGAIFIQRYRR